MIQLSGGIALASMAGCLGSDDDPKDTDDPKDDSGKNDDSSGNNGKKDDKPKSGDDAPKVDVETSDGKTITVEAKDKPTIVMFADVESEECKSYSETLADLHEKYGDRAYLLTVNTNMDVSKTELKEFHEQYGGDWDHAMGRPEVLEKYGIEATVTVCVIDENGKIAFRTDGEVDHETVEKALDAYAAGDLDEEDIEKALDAYRKGDVDEKDIEEAIEAYADD
ncbi:TlpA family protein disulfide reductase [Halalkalicoccus jeotgali]|uniref:Thioredoxin domain-containing protein n=2 Tax=Halalkalicoccus jeotgali (strain DSM 18796 / CECT 7217 / JCM 14584 / KCTC 4019 / B3) TaxID=795797 RepID=D8J2L4_HALJB|nr:redoxin domain-containing protein [Halalkalicoccus jeotgali]ADJ14971.1 hypothetical protein HacjB3_07930 [Halalkalicoccus jeotgali B3]